MIKLIDLTALHNTDDEIYSTKFKDNVEVFLNGVKLKNCVFCNVTRGFVIVMKTDLNDRKVIFGDDFLYEILSGDIKATWISGYSR